MSVDPNSVKPQPPLVQHEAVAASSLMSYVISLLIGLVGITLLAAYWFNHEANKVSIQHAAEASYPDLERLRLAGLQKLTRYERIDNRKIPDPSRPSDHTIGCGIPGGCSYL